MSSHDIRSAERPTHDQVLVDIADYVCNADVSSELAFETAHYCLMDTLAWRFSSARLPRVYQASRPDRARCNVARRCSRTRYILRTRTRYGRFQYWRDDSVARFQ